MDIKDFRENHIAVCPIGKKEIGSIWTMRDKCVISGSKLEEFACNIDEIAMQMDESDPLRRYLARTALDLLRSFHYGTSAAGFIEQANNDWHFEAEVVDNG